MKLLNREEFLKLPEGTLYAKYYQDLFGDICVKDASIGAEEEIGDFYTMPLINISDDVFDNDHSDASDSFVKTMQCDLDFDCYGRDGFFDKDQLFAVFEAKELSEITKILQTVLKLAINAETKNNATP
jgi:hypothetical protein